MDSYFNWFFSFITKMFGYVWNGIKGIFSAIIHIFDFKTYFGFFANYQEGFGFFGWFFAIISFLLVYAFWAGVVYLIIILVKKRVIATRSVRQSENLLEEIADLHKDMDKLVKEKEHILEMKYAPTVDFNELINEAEESANAEEEEANLAPRFYRLAEIDEKYVSFPEPIYNNDIDLKSLCEELRNFACYNSQLFYELKTIRLMIAGLSCTKMVLLQGISGTGKTSLPYVMGKYFDNPTTIASVQPSWHDRTELFGFFNEFTKKFNETDVLARIYESSFTNNMNFIILDEMNIARVEYYFAEMLSILEMPDPNEWKVQLVTSVWANDPKRLVAGKLQIPNNIWYVGTANNDDSTFSVSDKVYDRAFVINLDSKGVAFEAPETHSRNISADYVMGLFDKAVQEDPVTDALLNKVEQLDNYVIDHFKVAFGNRIIKQFKTFVPVYKACGGTEIEAVDYMLATKVFRKFESLNLALIRDEIKGLINQLDTIFGKGSMVECQAYLRRLQKSF